MNNDLAIQTGTFTKARILKFLISLAVAVGLWITEAIPSFAVSLFIIAFLVFALENKHFNSAPENIEKHVASLSNGVIRLMPGVFFLALAIKKTKLDVRFFRFAVRISSAPDSICYPPSLQKQAAILLAPATPAGMFLPVSDIQNSITYSTGYLEQTHFLKSGMVVGVLGPLLITI